jgi:hypothetical protein
MGSYHAVSRLARAAAIMRSVALVTVLSLALGCLYGCQKSKPAAQEQARKDVKTLDARTAPFVSGKRNRVYHTRECRYAADVNSPVGFASALDAESTGRLPCEFCLPRNSAAGEPAR